MKSNILAVVFCAVSLMAGCSSTDAETEKQIKEVEKFNAEQEKMKNSGVPAEKVCSVFKKWATAAEPADYKTENGSSYSCSTSRRVGNQGLIYSASGYNGKVSDAYISMSELFKRGENIQALKLLTEQGGELSNAFADQPLTKEIETAIEDSKPGEWKLGAAKVKLEKKEPQLDSYNLVLTFSLE